MVEEYTTFQITESQEEPYVLVIGDINIDILASAEETVEEGEILFGRVNRMLGGVGRNVAWNLRKLDIPVLFLTTIGSDLYGQKALEEAESLGVDVSHAKVLNDENTSTILYVEDKEGDVHIGIEDLHSLNPISPDYLKEKASLIHQADWCMVSGNLPKKTLDYLAETHKDTHFLFDPASKKMSEKAAEIFGRYHTVKPNQEEAEMLSHTSIETVEEAKRAGEKLCDEGVQQVFITLNDGGAVYNNGTQWIIMESSSISPVSSTGAGDAFSAALLYCFHHHLELDDSVKFAIAASTLTLQSKEAVHPDLSVKRVKQMIDEIDYRKIIFNDS